MRRCAFLNGLRVFREMNFSWLLVAKLFEGVVMVLSLFAVSSTTLSLVLTRFGLVTIGLSRSIGKASHVSVGIYDYVGFDLKKLGFPLKARWIRTGTASRVIDSSSQELPNSRSYLKLRSQHHRRRQAHSYSAPSLRDDLTVQMYARRFQDQGGSTNARLLTFKKPQRNRRRTLFTTMSKCIQVEVICTAMSANILMFSPVSAITTGQIQPSACQAVGMSIAALPVRHAAEAVPRRHRQEHVEKEADSREVSETANLSHIHTAI